LAKRAAVGCAAFAGQNIGVREVAERIWLVSLMHY
jgi:hypothetical protein